ncbi:helix-turn-helix transcriptional regulator [Prevotella sp. AGR2160]|uniref:helix-turn-helix transcriptional regulator n=1 Tax=Prevotella sp. AGR2160 TaxID=1280674 RepID=UPI00041574E6|nr:helix-turn-helix transcriptional regulator [Prevotella sp. AGR2160]
MDDINRLKICLVEHKKTNKWLAEHVGKDPATVSKWCTNTTQPDLVTLKKIAQLLDIDICELINHTKQ